MTLTQGIVIAGTLLLSGGVFLICRSVISTCTEMIVRLWQRVFRSWAGRRLREMGVITDQPTRETSVDWKRVAVILAIPILAVSVRDLMLSPLVIVIGAGIVAWIQFQAREIEQYQINLDAESVALQLRSLISVDHSLLNALTQIELAEGRLKRALTQVTRRLQMHQAPAEAVQAFAGLPGPVTGRLSALIAHSSSLTDAIQDDLLRSLEGEAHRQKLLRSKTRQTLALVRGTIRLLQAVVAGAILFVLLTPDWRIFFLQDLSHRFLLMFLIATSALASLYFEYEVYQLSYGERG